MMRSKKINNNALERWEGGGGEEGSLPELSVRGYRITRYEIILLNIVVIITLRILTF